MYSLCFWTIVWEQNAHVDPHYYDNLHRQSDVIHCEMFSEHKRWIPALLNISAWQNTALFFLSDCNVTLPADHPPLKPWLMSLGALTGEPNTQECFRALIPPACPCFVNLRNPTCICTNAVWLCSNSTADEQKCCRCCCFRAVGSPTPAESCPGDLGGGVKNGNSNGLILVLSLHLGFFYRPHTVDWFSG